MIRQDWLSKFFEKSRVVKTLGPTVLCYGVRVRWHHGGLKMKTRLVTLSFGIAVLSGAAMTANAQEAPVGLSVRAGLFLPSDAGTRDAGNYWFAFGAEFKLRDLMPSKTGNPSEISVSLDYANKGDFRTLPVTLNYTRHNGDLYYTVGAGISFTKNTTDDNSKFAYQGGIGFDFQKGAHPFFAEVRFLGNEDPKLNGFVFYVGTRF